MAATDSGDRGDGTRGGDSRGEVQGGTSTSTGGGSSYGDDNQRDGAVRKGCPYGKKANGQCATKDERDRWNALKQSTGMSAADLANSINNPSSGGGESGGSSGGGGGSGSTPASAPAVDTEQLLNDAIASGRTGLQDEFLRYGIDLNANGRGDADRFGWQQSSYNDEIDRYLNQIAGGISPGDEAPGQYFIPDQMFTDLRGRIEGDTVDRFKRELNTNNGLGAGRDRFADDFGSQFSQNVFDTQYSDAQGALQRGFDRGTLTQGAYDRAVGDLTGDRSGAQGRLDTYRRGVLDTTRSSYDDAVGQQKSNLGDFSLGGTFDLGGAQSQLNNTFNSLSNNFEGSFNNAIGNEKFFDWNTLIGNANANAGAENSKFNAPLWLKAKEESDANNDQYRGLGSTGGF